MTHPAVSNGSYDVARVREDFPALALKIYGKPLVYLANAASEGYEGGRAKVAQFLNARRNEEIVFTRNATEAINLVASSWGEPNLKAGDEIVLSIMEHHSNIVPWHFLRERHGA